MSFSEEKLDEFHPGTTEGSRILSSGEIFEGRREVLIRHGKDFYRLLITKAGKLILNK